MSELLEEIQEEFLTADARCNEVGLPDLANRWHRHRSNEAPWAKVPTSRGYTGLRHKEAAAGARAVGQNLCPAARGGGRSEAEIPTAARCSATDVV